MLSWVFLFNKGYSQDKCNCPQQFEKGKRTFYIGGGYNLDKFSRSTIYFKNHGADEYDFKLTSLKAIDRDGLNELFNEDITIPQYSFRIGYFFNNKRDIGIEINYDHVKYVVVQNQPTYINGTIHGEYYDKDTIMSPGLVMFEHTNGANYCMINVIKRYNFFNSGNKNHWLSYVFKGGFGFVYPRSDTKVLGNSNNDFYHVAGYVGGVESGLRYDFCKYFFFEATMKGCYANYTNVRLSLGGRGHHHFYSLEYIAITGFQFGM